MRNRLGEFELDEQQQKDTELTLGPAMLIGLLCGLLLVCAACFGLGYSLGRHNSMRVETAAAAQPQTPVAQDAGSLAKPQAKGMIPTVPAADTPASQTPPPAPVQPSNPLTSYAPAANVPATVPAPAQASLVHPALLQPVAMTPSGTRPVAGSGPMVQIAAVSHQEDADVLMGALRKHGYAVMARHMPGDSLIHVQIGPFATQAEANAMSQKLLGDGYNAVVLP